MLSTPIIFSVILYLLCFHFYHLCILLCNSHINLPLRFLQFHLQLCERFFLQFFPPSFISSWFNVSMLPYHFFQLREILFSSCPSSEAICLFLIILTYGKNVNHNYVLYSNIFPVTILIYWLVLLTFSTLQYFKCFCLTIFKRLQKTKVFINIY